MAEATRLTDLTDLGHLWGEWQLRPSTLPAPRPRDPVRYRDCELCDVHEVIRADGSAFEGRYR